MSWLSPARDQVFINSFGMSSIRRNPDQLVMLVRMRITHTWNVIMVPQRGTG
jgi:hypothetical protein